MRIGIITGEYPPMQGGVGAYTAILARELVTRGHQVAVLTSPPASIGVQDGVQVSAVIQNWGIGSLTPIRRWIDSFRPDVIDLQFQTAAYKMSPLVHFLPGFVHPTPFVTTFHDLRYPYLFPKAGPLRDWIVMRLARTSSGVIVTNHEDADRLKAHPCVRLIPIGSNILSTPSSDTAPVRQTIGVAPDEKLIAYFGLVNRSKGLDTLLTAVRQVLDSGVKVKLALVGAVAGDSDPTNQAYIREIDALITNLNLDTIIFRTPYLQDAEVAAYLSAADVVALPFADGASYRRGSLMAAIRLGCPIVTTSPNVEISAFQDGVNMRLIPPGDSAALANAITGILNDSALQNRLRANSTAIAETFEWSHIARGTTEFFEQVIADRSRG